MTDEKRYSDEELYSRCLRWRFLDDRYDSICVDCNGSGIKIYSSTSTYFYGVGGCAMTHDVCDKCWGSGDESNPFRNIKKLLVQKKEN